MNQPRSLAQHVARVLVVNLLTCAVVYIAALFVGIELNVNREPAQRPAVEASADAVAEDLGCWSGAAPVGQEAGSVLLREHGRPVVRDGRVFDLAIDQEVYGNDHGLDVAAFCPAADGDLEVVR